MNAPKIGIQSPSNQYNYLGKQKISLEELVDEAFKTLQTSKILTLTKKIVFFQQQIDHNSIPINGFEFTNAAGILGRTSDQDGFETQLKDKIHTTYHQIHLNYEWAVSSTTDPKIPPYRHVYSLSPFITPAYF